MKLRMVPEDFRVYEINKFEILQKGDYKLYMLEKIGMEAFEIIDILSRKTRIPYDAFGIAGLKDRHAVTKQYFTIPAKYDINLLTGEGYKIQFMGYVEKPIKIGNLQGNRFEIVVRDIAKGEIQGVMQKAENLEVPNYYDSQRFRSVTDKQFVAKHLINKNYEKAVKLYLTSYSKSEPKYLKDDKRMLLENWGKQVQLKTKRLADVIETYYKTKSWIKAYQKIPGNIREILVSAYQSYLWNECVKIFLRKYLDTKYLYSVEYSVGSLLFFKKKIGKQIPETFQTISRDMKPAEHEKNIVSYVLKKEGLELKDFDIRETGNFYKSHEREVIIKPAGFKISKPEPDEFNHNRYKITVEFELPKGSYATVVIKRLFNR